MNKKFKLSTIFSLVSSCVLLIIGIVGLCYFAPKRQFIQFMDQYLKEPLFSDMTLEEILAEIVDIDYLMPILYIVFLIYSIFNIITATLGLIFTFLCLKDYDLSYEDFQKRKKIHIAYIVFVGVNFFSSDIAVGSSVSSGLSLLNSAISLFFIISFIFGIMGLKFNSKKLAETSNSHPEMNNPIHQPIEEVYFDKPNREETKDTYEDNSPLAKEENQKPSTPPVNNEKLMEAYELLAKLEKSHLNNEITDEDYERMKKTIMDNFSK